MVSIMTHGIRLCSAEEIGQSVRFDYTGTMLLIGGVEGQVLSRVRVPEIENVGRAERMMDQLGRSNCSTSRHEKNMT
jgi:hypothetical protein